MVVALCDVGCFELDGLIVAVGIAELDGLIVAVGIVELDGLVVVAVGVVELGSCVLHAGVGDLPHGKSVTVVHGFAAVVVLVVAVDTLLDSLLLLVGIGFDNLSVIVSSLVARLLACFSGFSSNERTCSQD